MITEQRWEKAQEGEAAYWSGCGRNAWHILHELTEHCKYVVPHLKPILEGRNDLDAVEIGVGCLGIGFLAVHADKHCRRIVGDEPLEIESIELEDEA